MQPSGGSSAHCGGSLASVGRPSSWASASRPARGRHSPTGPRVSPLANVRPCPARSKLASQTPCGGQLMPQHSLDRHTLQLASLVRALPESPRTAHPCLDFKHVSETLATSQPSWASPPMAPAPSLVALSAQWSRTWASMLTG